MHRKRSTIFETNCRNLFAFLWAIIGQADSPCARSFLQLQYCYVIFTCSLGDDARLPRRGKRACHDSSRLIAVYVRSRCDQWRIVAHQNTAADVNLLPTINLGAINSHDARLRPLVDRVIGLRPWMNLRLRLLVQPWKRLQPGNRAALGTRAATSSSLAVQWRREQQRQNQRDRAASYHRTYLPSNRPIQNQTVRRGSQPSEYAKHKWPHRRTRK